MTIHEAFRIVRLHAVKEQRRSYNKLVNKIINIRKRLGTNNNLKSVYANIKDYVSELAVDTDGETLETYKHYLKNIAYWYVLEGGVLDVEAMDFKDEPDQPDEKKSEKEMVCTITKHTVVRPVDYTTQLLSVSAGLLIPTAVLLFATEFIRFYRTCNGST